MAAAGRLVAQLHEQLGERVCLLNIAEKEAPLPAAEVRRAMSAVLEDRAAALSCSALVFEATGFKAAAVRALVSRLSSLGSQPVPHRIFATVGDAYAWMAQSLHAPPGPLPELLAGIAEMRERITEVRERTTQARAN